MEATGIFAYLKSLASKAKEQHKNMGGAAPRVQGWMSLEGLIQPWNCKRSFTEETGRVLPIRCALLMPWGDERGQVTSGDPTHFRSQAFHSLSGLFSRLQTKILAFLFYILGKQWEHNPLAL